MAGQGAEPGRGFAWGPAAPYPGAASLRRAPPVRPSPAGMAGLGQRPRRRRFLNTVVFRVPRIGCGTSVTSEGLSRGAGGGFKGNFVEHRVVGGRGGACGPRYAGGREVAAAVAAAPQAGQERDRVFK